MAIDFPSSPILGDLYTTQGTTYKWDGTQWVVYDGNPSPVLQVDPVNRIVKIDEKIDLNGVIVTADNVFGGDVPNITVSSSPPSGGSDGDIWMQYS